MVNLRELGQPSRTLESTVHVLSDQMNPACCPHTSPRRMSAAMPKPRPGSSDSKVRIAHEPLSFRTATFATGIPLMNA